MTGKEQIEEMKLLICDKDKQNRDCHKCGSFCFNEHIANTYYNAGYRKTIWHKVADGDLPDSDREILIATKSGNVESGQYNDFTCEDGVNRFRFIDRFYDFVDDVIAWTELPTYKE